MSEALDAIAPFRDLDARALVSGRINSRRRRRVVARVASGVAGVSAIAFVIAAIPSPDASIRVEERPGSTLTVAPAQKLTTTSSVPSVDRGEDPASASVETPAGPGSPGRPGRPHQDSPTTVARPSSEQPTPAPAVPAPNVTPTTVVSAPMPVLPTPALPTPIAPIGSATRVIAILDDSGLRFEPAHVPFGPVDVTFQDARTLPHDDVQLHRNALAIQPGVATSVPVGVGSVYFYVMQANGLPLEPFVGRPLIVDGPTLAPPAEPELEFTIDLGADGFTLPYRQIGTQVPYLEGAGVPSARTWTAAPHGRVRFLVRNPLHLDHKIYLEGREHPWRIKPDMNNLEFVVNFDDVPAGTSVLWWETAGHRAAGQELALWLY